MVLYWYQIPRPALDAAQGMNYRHMWAKVVKHTHTHTSERSSKDHLVTAMTTSANLAMALCATEWREGRNNMV